MGAHPVTSSFEDWLEMRESMDDENQTQQWRRLSGTRKGEVLAKAGRADELLQEVAELKKALALKDEALSMKDKDMRHEVAELKEDMRHEVAELKKAIALKDEALSKKDLRIQKLTDKLLNIE